MLSTPRSLRGAVTSPHHLASQAGLKILREGGTAVEAAVATAACLAVVCPHMTCIGGDGFWLVSEPDGQVWAIDACGPSALNATPDLYKGEQAIPWRGPKAAITVAGTVGGWDVALRRGGGALPLESLLEDAVFHAEHGVPVTEGGAQIAAAKSAELRSQYGYASVFEPDGRPLRTGDIVRQPAIGRTLRRLGDHGLDDFYRGGIAKDIAQDLESAGSPLGQADLEAYRAALVRPLEVTVSGARLLNLPPPTQGLASLLILAMFDRLGVAAGESFAHIHLLVEATKQAFLVRDAHIGDPVHMEIVPQALLNRAGALDALAGSIDPLRALAWPQPASAGDTTWFGTADDRGQVVSCIQSTYFEFGSGIVLPQTGITWQNRGCSFQLSGHGPNRLAPRRKPFHTLNPALAQFEDGRVMAYGTMGGEGQPQTQAALFSRYAYFGQSLQQSITAPRWLLGRTWGEESVTLKLEDRFDPALVAALRDAGHDVELVPAFSSVMGHAGALVRHANGLIEGAADPRGDGVVATW